MTADEFKKHCKCGKIIRIPKQEYKTIKGHELRRGRVVKKK
jgi:hypothetical protein